ncbi:MAG: helix-turn-helix transcriptional regulator [Lachnospiraceae bacterium]|nr:helix-turn-helix transcriptional regulator [Lachnospiraceae bacterium]
MTKAEILKKEILSQYRSVRQFAMEMGIPYSTLVTALERGIEGMAYGTVIKMCDKLSLNPVDFSSLERDASLGAQLLENRVMQYYVKLNQDGRDKILELMDDFVSIDKYKELSQNKMYYLNPRIT